jgi:hypothetical protein
MYPHPMETLDAYDIECLMHVYNKFGPRKGKEPITNATQLLNHNGRFINDGYNSYKLNQLCTISIKLATFLGQPADSILTINQIYDLFNLYRTENNLVEERNYLTDGIRCNEELCYLLDWLTLGQPYKLIFISLHEILDELIYHKDIQIVIPEGSYVLK